MKNTNILLLSVAIVGLILGIMIGTFFTPEYKSHMYDKNMSNLGSYDRTYDLRYLNAMIAHHRGAMLLARQAIKNSTRNEIKSMGEAIITDEEKAIAELMQFKMSIFGDSRPVKDPPQVNLGEPGINFDLRFLNALIVHHEEGIAMAKDVKQKSTRTEIIENVFAVEKFLTDHIVTLKQLRYSWYQI